MRNSTKVSKKKVISLRISSKNSVSDSVTKHHFVIHFFMRLQKQPNNILKV